MTTKISFPWHYSFLARAASSEQIDDNNVIFKTLLPTITTDQLPRSFGNMFKLHTVDTTT